MPTDPTLDPSVFDKLYHSGAWICIAILVLFFALRFASTSWAWLRDDHRAVWVSAILGGLALLVVPASQGTTPNLSMIIGAIVTVASLHANPKKPSPMEQKIAQAGFIRLGLMAAIAVLAAVVLMLGCSGSTRQRDLGYTLTGVVSASAALDAYVGPHELALGKCDPATVAKADCEARVATFQNELAKARATIRAVSDLIGAGYKANTDASVTTAEAAAAQLYTLLKTLGVSL